jgi:hypothetical protein
MGGELRRDTEATPRALPQDWRERHGPGLEAMAATIEREAASGSSPDVVARAVVHALTSRRPRVRHPVGARAGRILLLRRVLPDRWMDRVFLRAIGLRSAPSH